MATLTARNRLKASAFARENPTVSTVGDVKGPGPKLFYRLADGSSFYSAFLADQLTEKTAIVLVNGYTASASEILSGGIRAEDAGIVVGSRTYGKGSAQIVLDSSRYPELFDGDSLKITAYRFYCSDGNTTDKIGVLPTLLVSDEYTADVAALLKTEKPQSGDYLHFSLNSREFYVPLDMAKEEKYSSALRELLTALPPDVAVRCSDDGTEIPSRFRSCCAAL